MGEGIWVILCYLFIFILDFRFRFKLLYWEL